MKTLKQVASSFVIFLFCIVIFISCTPKSEPPTGETSLGDAKPEANAPTAVKPVPKNIGDVEQTIFINVKVSDKSKTPKIIEESKADALERCRLLTLDVLPPFPEELWLDVECQCRDNYDEAPVVIRGTFMLDNQPTTEGISIVLGERSNQTHPLPPIEVMRLVGSPLPDTVLLRLDIEGLLMPLGTDPNTINPLTADTTPDRKSKAVLGTAVRINFKKEGMGKPITDIPGPPLNESNSEATAPSDSGENADSALTSTSGT